MSTNTPERGDQHHEGRHEGHVDESRSEQGDELRSEQADERRDEQGEGPGRDSQVQDTPVQESGAPAEQPARPERELPEPAPPVEPVEPERVNGPYLATALIGLVCLAVAGVALGQELGDLTVDWGSIGPLGIVAIGAALVVLGVLGLAGSRRGQKG